MKYNKLLKRAIIMTIEKMKTFMMMTGTPLFTGTQQEIKIRNCNSLKNVSKLPFSRVGFNRFSFQNKMRKAHCKQPPYWSNQLVRKSLLLLFFFLLNFLSCSLKHLTLIPSRVQLVTIDTSGKNATADDNQLLFLFFCLLDVTLSSAQSSLQSFRINSFISICADFAFFFNPDHQHNSL